MQGIFIHEGGRMIRPKSKKQVREAAAADPSCVILEATSVFFNEYGGSLKSAPQGKYTFVGPDPYTKRNFYGSIEVGPNGKIKVS